VRLHGTLRPDFLDDAELFESVETAQAAVDAWVACYNTDRPHQGLDVKVPVVPADRFVAAEPAEGVKLWLPATLEVLDTPRHRPGGHGTGHRAGHCACGCGVGGGW
jgi:hypothetical protein